MKRRPFGISKSPPKLGAVQCELERGRAMAEKLRMIQGKMAAPELKSPLPQALGRKKEDVT